MTLADNEGGQTPSRRELRQPGYDTWRCFVHRIPLTVTHKTRFLNLILKKKIVRLFVILNFFGGVFIWISSTCWTNYALGKPDSPLSVHEAVQDPLSVSLRSMLHFECKFVQSFTANWSLQIHSAWFHKHSSRGIQELLFEKRQQ